MIRAWLQPLDPQEFAPPSNCFAAMGTWSENFMLSYLLAGGTATRPIAWGIGLSLGSPTSVSGSEIPAGSGIIRVTGSFSSAAAGTWTNAAAATFGPINAAGSVSGIDVFDTVQATYTANGGDLLLYGLLSTARTLGSGDSLVLASGAMSVTLS